MPLSRLLSIIFALLFLSGIIYYVMYEGDDSSPSSIDVPSSQFESGESEENDFLAAVTIPANFSKFPFPVRIEKLDWMIERCNHLLNQNSDYSDKIEKKLFGLFALKSALMAENGVDPAPVVEQLEKLVQRVSGSSTVADLHQYLIVVTYMAVLSSNPESDMHDNAIKAISKINEATPVPPPKAIACYNSALKYYVKSADKTKSGDLLRLLGAKLSLAKEPRLSDLGLSLTDYPNFSYYYQDSFNMPKSGERFEAETFHLLKQIEKYPPQSLKTYDLLMTVPEQYLQSGNTKVALKISAQLRAAASQSNELIREKVFAKIAKLTDRINLLGSNFELAGSDVTGASITLSKKEQTLILFWDPDNKSSADALVRIFDSRLYDRWTTTVLVASVSELTPDEIFVLKRKYSRFRFVDGPTSKDWLERTGVNEVPYLITLDQTGVVQRLGTP